MSNKKLTRREFLKTSALGTASVVAAASGMQRVAAKPRLARPARQSATTLTLIDPWSNTSLGEAHDAQIERFMDSHPGITVERSDIPFSDFRQLS
jgi:ABC-type glycerol-3-phosphate transport system substrate-binding protein